MSGPSGAEERLDALVAVLADARPRLDDVTRARVGARLEEAVRDEQVAADRRAIAAPTRARRIGFAVAFAAMAAAIAMYATRREAAPPPPARASAPSLAEGAAVTARAGESAQWRVDGAGAVVTVYGPGWLRRDGDRVVVDAHAIVVDRADARDGATPIELDFRGASIRAMRATFAIDGTTQVRVTVMRGELVLRCAEATRTVREGEAAQCADTPAPLPAPPRLPALVPPRPPPTAPAPPSDRAPVSTAVPPTHGASQRAPRLAIEAPVPSAAPPPAPSEERPRHDDVVPAAPPPPTVAERYAAAEALMRAHDPDGARAALRALIADASAAAPELAPALFDLARLDAATGDAAGALDSLDRLDRMGDRPEATALAEPAAFLRCVVTLAGDPRGGRACLVAFRARFPGSIHGVEALGRIAISFARDGDCAHAAPLLDEYLDRAATAALAPAVRSWRARCTAAP